MVNTDDRCHCFRSGSVPTTLHIFCDPLQKNAFRDTARPSQCDAWQISRFAHSVHGDDGYSEHLGDFPNPQESRRVCCIAHRLTSKNGTGVAESHGPTLNPSSCAMRDAFWAGISHNEEAVW